MVAAPLLAPSRWAGAPAPPTSTTTTPPRPKLPPQFDTPAPIIEAGIEALRQGYTRYTPNTGTSALRKAICEKLQQENGLAYSPEEIVSAFVCRKLPTIACTKLPTECVWSGNNVGADQLQQQDVQIYSPGEIVSCRGVGCMHKGGGGGSGSTGRVCAVCVQHSKLALDEVCKCLLPLQVVSNGAKQCIWQALLATCSEDDEVDGRAG